MIDWTQLTLEELAECMRVADGLFDNEIKVAHLHDAPQVRTRPHALSDTDATLRTPPPPHVQNHAKAKFTVKNAVYCRRSLLQTAFLTVILA